MSFNDTNSNPRDRHLKFEPRTHTYTLGDRVLTSVTTLVESCFPKFDADYWAERKAPSMGLTPEELKAKWEAEGEKARRLGTTMHDRIEHFYLGEDYGDDGEAFGMFRRWAQEVTLHPFRTEWRIYHEDFGVAGTLDFLERTPDGTFNIYDWKRSRKLIDSSGRPVTVNSYGKCGFGPAATLHDIPYCHYALQVSIYRIILEMCYDIKVSGMKLGVFHPANPSYYTITLPYLHDEALAILHHHRNHLK